MVLLFIVVFFGLAATENVRVSINDKYLDYVAEVVDRTFIKEWGPTMMNQALPGSEGTLYKIDGLQIKEIDLGYSEGSLHDGYMLLALQNATAKITGAYEAYSFWTITGELVLQMAGTLTLNVSITESNLLNMTGCTADYSQVDLDLQKTGLGWLAPLLKPTIKGQVEGILCDIIDSNLINVTNGVIEAIPEKVSGAGGDVSLSVEQIALFNHSAEIVLQVGESGNQDMSPIQGMQQDMCMQIREEVWTSLGQAFVGAGTVATSLDVINLLYGAASKPLHDDVQLYLNNTGKIRVGFAEKKTFLLQVGVDAEILIRPTKELNNEPLNIGSLAMSGTINAKLTRPGNQHVVEYALNNLISAQKYVKIDHLSYDTAGRQLVGCSSLRLKEEFIQSIIDLLLK